MPTQTLVHLALAAGALLPSVLPAQDWAQRVEQRWPGAAIRKVSEAQLEVWVAGQPGADDKAAAARAFVALQWSAYGLPADATNKTFLVPSGRGVRAPASGNDGGVMEGPEPNGDPAASGGGTPTRIGCGDQGEGRVFPYGDRDWWQVDLAAAKTIVALTGDGIGSAPVGDTMLELYDANGNLLGANDDDPSRAPYSALAVSVQPGRYYVAVRGYVDVHVGSYALDIICAPPGSGGGPRRVGEAAEPNSSASTATSLACGDQGYGDLQPGSESDWWSLTLTQATDVDAETSPDGPSPCQDTYLYLRDASGALIASDDDGGSGLYSRIQIRLQPGTYYFDMQSYAARYAGGYALDIRCGSGGGGSPASFTAHTGGCAGSAGTPSLSSRANEVPLIGSTFAMDLANLPGNGRAFTFLGISTTMTSGGISLPFDLGALGAPGCQLEVDPIEIQGLTASAAGVATAYVPLPYDTNLLGITLHAQAIVLDSGANAFGATTSNRGTMVLGNGL